MIDLFAEIKARINISDILSFYGVRLNSHNKALCPFHSEDTPSLVVYPDTNSFYCFGCGTGGSVVDFVGNLYGLEPLDAARKLNDDFNLGLTNGLLAPYQRRELERKAAERQQANYVAADFEKWLDDYITYLYAAVSTLEGITKSEAATAKDFTMLYAREWELNILEYGTLEEQIALYLDIMREVKA